MQTHQSPHFVKIELAVVQVSLEPIMALCNPFTYKP
jgi:hypothetical protein